MLKIEPRKDITEQLYSLMSSTMDQWKDLKSGTATKDMWNNQTIPNDPHKNVDGGFQVPPSNYMILSIDKVIKMYLLKLVGAKKFSNALIYAPNSFMSWHTNINNIGTRHYYTYTTKESIFRYIKDGEIIDDIDNIGWTARSFEIKEDEPLWHTVYTNGIRFSFGFTRKENEDG